MINKPSRRINSPRRQTPDQLPTIIAWHAPFCSRQQHWRRRASLRGKRRPILGKMELLCSPPGSWSPRLAILRGGSSRLDAQSLGLRLNLRCITARWARAGTDASLRTTCFTKRQDKVSASKWLRVMCYQSAPVGANLSRWLLVASKPNTSTPSTLANPYLSDVEKDPRNQSQTSTEMQHYPPARLSTSTEGSRYNASPRSQTTAYGILLGRYGERVGL
jgi:hypothetical protein